MRANACLLLDIGGHQISSKKSHNQRLQSAPQAGRCVRSKGAVFLVPGVSLVRVGGLPAALGVR